DAPAPAGDGDIASCYDVYRSRSSPVDVSDPANLVAIVRRGDTQRDDTILRPAGARYFYACSSLDKGNNESRAVEQAAFIPEIAEVDVPGVPLVTRMLVRRSTGTRFGRTALRDSPGSLHWSRSREALINPSPGRGSRRRFTRTKPASRHQVRTSPEP